MKTAQKVIKVKVGVLELAKPWGNVSQACKVRGYSRDSFYRFTELSDEGGEAALQEWSRRKPNLKNRVAPESEEAVLGSALEQPAWGQVRAATELAKRGMPISAAGVRCVWERQHLENLNNRLRAWEAKGAQESHILTEAQVAAWEKAKGEKEAHGEFESACPGSCGAPDTCSGGTLKGGGRIYQPTFVDPYSKGAFAKLYAHKTSLPAAELLNDRVVPFFANHEIPLPRILTDRGTEYCGSPDSHEYELYVASENIDHTRTTVKSPQTNGSVERLPRPLLTECYRITFRKKIYPTLVEWQKDLEEWLRYDNEERIHQGRWCYGRTPMPTCLDTIPLAKEKLLAAS
jgi:transposase InsO family protein